MQTISATVNASGSVSDDKVEAVRKAAEAFEKACKDAGLTPTVEVHSPVGTQAQQLESKIQEDNQRRAGVMTPAQQKAEQERLESIEKDRQAKEHKR